MIAAPRRGVRGVLQASRPPDGLWTVVLAAGGARRFGRHKLLRRTGRNSLLSLAAGNAAALTQGRCVVVLGCAASRLVRELHGLGVRVVVNRRWRDGMAGSLRTGIAALPSSATAALVVLADQYALDPSDLRRLAVAWCRAPARPAAAWFQGRTGAPAILPRAWFRQVACLEGDEGARTLLRAPGVATTRVAMPAARLDLDVAGQIDDFRRHARRTGAPRLAKPGARVYIR